MGVISNEQCQSQGNWCNLYVPILGEALGAKIGV